MMMRLWEVEGEHKRSGGGGEREDGVPEGSGAGWGEGETCKGGAKPMLGWMWRFRYPGQARRSIPTGGPGRDIEVPLSMFIYVVMMIEIDKDNGL